MEQTIQNLFAENPYFAFAGFVAMIGVSLFILKKLKNIIIGLVILLIGLSIYLYRVDILSGDIFSRIVKAKSINEIQLIYKDFIINKKDEIRQKTKEQILDSLTEDL
jgi:uncharacterized membrane protein